jgi:NodT family efflux transporter outer membrane factor (OMF) lipoprotein
VLAATAAAAAALSGCNFAPPYHLAPVATNLPATYKEVGPWTPAAPADAAPRGDWWTVFGDARLNALEAKLQADNPNLAQSLARYDEARAFYAQTRADLFPQVGLTAQTGPAQLSHERLGSVPGLAPTRGANNIIGTMFSYEIDLWGRVRNEVAAGKAGAQAGAADLASTRLSLEAQLADTYMTLRSLDAQGRVLDQTVADYQKALQLTEARHDGGAAPELDVSEAQTQLHSAEAARSEVRAQRALAEHAIASLVGTPATVFSLPVETELPPLPQTPVSAPSVLLQRRPDVAAAERRAFAANRQIGVARAAYFPTITLTGAAGYQNNSFSVPLIASPASYWSLGPQLAATLFDGGRRRAEVKGARASFEEASANYRATVLAAFQQVEDNLALLNQLADESSEEESAFQAARHSEDLALTQYKLGAQTYLFVITAQTAALQAEQAVIGLDARRLQASVELVRALGGGWNDSSLKAVSPA